MKGKRTIKKALTVVTMAAMTTNTIVAPISVEAEDVSLDNNPVDTGTDTGTSSADTGTSTPDTTPNISDSTQDDLSSQSATTSATPMAVPGVAVARSISNVSVDVVDKGNLYYDGYNRYYGSSITLQFRFSGDNVSNINAEVYIDNVMRGTVCTDSTGTATFTISENIANSIDIVIVESDQSYSFNNILFSCDKEAPELSYQGGTLTKGEDITLSLTDYCTGVVKDSNGISVNSITINNVEVPTHNTSDNGESGTSIVIPWSVIEELGVTGTYNIAVNATDYFGNNATRTVTVNTAYITLECSVVRGKYVVRDGVVYAKEPVEVSITNTNSNDIPATLLVDGESVPVTNNNVSFTIDSTGTHSYIYSPTNPAYGPNVSLSLQDFFGSGVDSISFDTDAPSVDINSPSGATIVPSGEERYCVLDSNDGTTLNYSIAESGSGLSTEFSVGECTGIDSSDITYDASSGNVSIDLSNVGVFDRVSYNFTLKDQLGNERTVSDTFILYGFELSDDYLSLGRDYISGNYVVNNNTCYTDSNGLSIDVSYLLTDNRVSSVSVGDTTIDRSSESSVILFNDGNLSISVNTYTGNTYSVALPIPNSVSVDTTAPELVNSAVSVDSSVVSSSDNGDNLEVYLTAGDTFGFPVLENTGEVAVTGDDRVSYDSASKMVIVKGNGADDHEEDISFTLNDSLGNSRSYSFKLYVMRSEGADIVIGENNIDGYYSSEDDTFYTNSSTVDINATINNVWSIDSMSLCLDGSTLSPIEVSPDGLFSISITDSGSYSIKIVRVDGKEMVVKLSDFINNFSGNIVFDMEFPSINDIEYDGDISTYNGINYYLSANTEIKIPVIDSGSGIDKNSLKVTLNSQELSLSDGDYSIEDITNGYYIVISDEKFAEGMSTISVSCSDMLCQSMSKSYSVYFDRYNIPLNVSTDTDGNLFVNDSSDVSVTYTSGDIILSVLNLDATNLSSVRLYKNGLLVDTLSNGMGRNSFTISDSGEYTVRVYHPTRYEEYDLGEIWEGLSGTIIFDTNSPDLSSSCECNSDVDNDGNVYYTSDGTYSIKISDIVSGVDPDSISVHGVTTYGIDTDDNGDYIISIPTTSLADGIYSVVVSVEDNVGNSSSETYTFRLYRETPGLSGLSHEEVVIRDGVSYFGGRSGSLDISLGVSQYDKIKSLIVYKDDSEGSKVYLDLSESLGSKVDFTIDESGIYHIEVVDRLDDVYSYSLENLFTDGNITSNLSFDETVPVFDSVVYNGDSRVNGDTTYYLTDSTIVITASDSGAGINSNTWSVEGVEGINDYVSVEGNMLTIDTTGLPEGASTLTVSISDSLGNVYLKSIPVMMHRSFPVISGSTIEGNLYTSDDGVTYFNEDITFGLRGFESYKIADIEVLKDGNSYGHVWLDTGTFSISESGSYSIRVTDISGESHTYTFEELFDGDLASSMVYDNALPTVSSYTFSGETKRNSDGEEFYMSNGTIAISVEDSLSGIDMDSWSTDDIDSQYLSYDFDSQSLLIDTTGLNEGTNEIIVSVDDNLGNTLTYVFSVHMFRELPVVSGLSVDGNYYVSGGKTYISGDLDVALKGTNTYKIASIEVLRYVEGGYETVGTIDKSSGTYSFTDNGTYAIRVTDITEASVVYTLEGLFGISDEIVVDEEAPVLSNYTFSGDIKTGTIDNREFYMSDGIINISVEDALSGVNSSTWSVTGIDSSAVSVDSDGLGISIDTSKLQEGVSNFTVRVDDNLGHSLKKEYSIHMFRVLPEITGISHTGVSRLNGTSYLNRNIDIELDGYDSYKIYSIELLKDGVHYGSISDLGRTTIADTGIYSIKTVDITGTERIYSLEELFNDIDSSVIIDREVPSAELSIDDDSISNAWVTSDGILRVRFTDNEYLKDALVTVNDSTFNVDLGSLRDSEYTVSLRDDVTRATDGIYNVNVVVNDLAGNSYSIQDTVYADFDAPEFSNLRYDGYIVEDAGNVYLRGDLILNGNYSDIGSGIESVELVRNGGVVGTGLPVSISEDGEYYLRVTDYAGLSTTVSISSILGTTSNNIIVDNSNPVISEVSGFSPDLVDNGIEWYASHPTFVISVQDANMREISVSVNGNVVISDVSSNGLYTIDTTGLEGNVNISVKAVDKVGGVSEYSYSYMSDTTAPVDISSTIDIVGLPKDGHVFYDATPSISVRALDNGVGISEYRIYGSKEESNITGEFTLDTGEYYVSVVDRLGNESQRVSLSDLLGLAYNALIVDTEAPSISINRPTADSENGWYGSDIDISVNTRDNIGINNIDIYINGVLVANNPPMTYNHASETMIVNTSSVPVSSNGQYEILVRASDNAGNTVESSDVVYIDRDAPTVDEFVFTGEGAFEGATTGGSDNRYGFFFNGSAVCTIHVSDGAVSSGLGTVNVNLENENGEVSKQVLQLNNGTAVVSIPDNFRGFISAYATDNVGHSGDMNMPDGMVNESSNTHINSTRIDISIPNTEYRDVSGLSLYNSDTTAEAVIGCSMSGLREVSWGIGDTTMQTISIDANGNPSDGNIVSVEKNLLLTMSNALSMTGNANGLNLWVRVTDRAGNVSEESVNFSIDKDAPIINVTYDSTEEDTYYNTPRTATITVTERNFDASMFVVSGTSGSLSGWTHNGDVHTATMTFASDDTYNFTLECTDLAGNVATAYNSQTFTVDTTSPTLSVSWSDNSPINSNYYSTNRTATLTIVDNTFDGSLIHLEGDGVLSGWSHNGNIHTATVSFGGDGKFEFAISGEDLAGNQLERYESGVFNIDTTNPELEIEGVQNAVSYKKDIGFTIRMSDSYIDMSRTNVTLTGKRSGNVRVDGTLNTTTGEYVFDNFPMEQQYDGIYILRVTVTDMAGNVSSESIVFSVNRFGSSYEFSNSGILNNYVNVAEDVVITESNVDRLNMDDAMVSILLNGTDIEVDPSWVSIKESESEDGKYIYTYTISKEAFEEDGMYVIQIYSHAEEGTNYNSLSQEYGFMLDTTPPEIIVSGIESGKSYKGYSRDVTIDVRDLSGVQSITVLLNGEVVELNQSDSLYTFSITESDAPQNIEVTVTDMAGNTSSYSVTDFTVSSEISEYIVNQNWFVWLISGASAAIIALLALLLKRRHDKNKEEKSLMKEHEDLYRTSSSSSNSLGNSRDNVEDLDDISEKETTIIEDDDKNNK